ncbi:MAG: multidrug efflux SMR transporter [Paracoccaceae bacterium]
MAWIILIAAGLLEVVWAYYLKQSHGLTRLVPSLVTLVTASGSFFLLAIAMRSLPLGTAYMIWTGIGAIGAFAVGVLVMGEPASAPRMAAACLILSGLVLMKLSA